MGHGYLRSMQRNLDLLGRHVVDRVTDRRGVVVSVSWDLYGCVQALLVSRVVAGGEKPQDPGWYDMNRLTAMQGLAERERVMSLPAHVEAFLDYDFEEAAPTAAAPPAHGVGTDHRDGPPSKGPADKPTKL